MCYVLCVVTCNNIDSLIFTEIHYCDTIIACDHHERELCLAMLLLLVQIVHFSQTALQLKPFLKQLQCMFYLKDCTSVLVRNSGTTYDYTK